MSDRVRNTIWAKVTVFLRELAVDPQKYTKNTHFGPFSGVRSYFARVPLVLEKGSRIGVIIRGYLRGHLRGPIWCQKGSILMVFRVLGDFLEVPTRFCLSGNSRVPGNWSKTEPKVEESVQSGGKPL